METPSLPEHLPLLAAWMASHSGNIIRSVSPAGVLVACAATSADGWPYSELSGHIYTVSAARNWLGY